MAKKPSPAPASAEPVIVNPRWLAIAVALTLLLAALCGYGALCLLFYQGQWQLLYHPSRTLSTTPADEGMRFDDVHFDVNSAGQSQLDGWWIPASPAAPYPSVTILFLHDAHGSLSDCNPALATLHTAGVNVFAFDYRGFGRSAGSHPTERLATADALAAWTYLTDLRHIPPRSLIVYGDGVGATFAAHVAARFAPAGIILQDPNRSARQIFLTDARARIVPLWLLQTENLDPTADLAATHIPRLFLDIHGDSARTRTLFAASSYPKQYVDLRFAPETTVLTAVRRFLDDVLH
ncbi:MAG TPA: alpha/beta fold hydrolase [Acidobacteriaceae bacterium]|nr:alpha/beta fold hydrolase [Acidobacteriaceae bacterium]